MIKVAENSYRLANQKGRLSAYLLWCELKGYNTQGSIGRDQNSIEKAAKYLTKSTSTLRTRLTELIEMGLVRRHKYSYTLVSYDTCWEILGLDVSLDKKKNRKGSFVVFKHERVDLKEKIELSEILLHQRREAYQARKSILADTATFTDTERNALKGCRYVDLPQLLDNLYVKHSLVLERVQSMLQRIELGKFLQAKGRSFNFIKITPFLTCKKTSIILGYKESDRTGQTIRKRIQSVGLATWTTRDSTFLNTIPWVNGVLGEDLLSKYSQRLCDNGISISHRIISHMAVV